MHSKPVEHHSLQLLRAGLQSHIWFWAPPIQSPPPLSKSKGLEAHRAARKGQRNGSLLETGKDRCLNRVSLTAKQEKFRARLEKFLNNLTQHCSSLADKWGLGWATSRDPSDFCYSTILYSQLGARQIKGKQKMVVGAEWILSQTINESVNYQC